MEKGSAVRKADYPIHPLFLDRWSPRGMSGEPIEDNELFTLFEAARWAPSSYNIQPWRFIYAKRDTAEWDKFFDLLVEFNRLWAENASVLVCLIAKKTDHEGKLNPVHVSDAGAAWENLALQGTVSKLVVHGMVGFDYEKARTVLNVGDDYAVVHMFAVGKHAPATVLPERMQKSEHPNDRKPVKDLIFKGTFKQ